MAHGEIFIRFILVVQLIAIFLTVRGRENAATALMFGAAVALIMGALTAPMWN